jgi:hypothetical protein
VPNALVIIYVENGSAYLLFVLRIVEIDNLIICHNSKEYIHFAIGLFAKIIF